MSTNTYEYNQPLKTPCDPSMPWLTLESTEYTNRDEQLLGSGGSPRQEIKPPGWLQRTPAPRLAARPGHGAPHGPRHCFLKLLSATARKYLRSTDETQERLGLGLEHRRGFGSHPPAIETRQWHFGKDLPKTKSFFRSPAEVAEKLSKRR